MSFWCLQFFPKTNENKSTWDIVAVKSKLFFHCSEETSDWKSHLNFVLPLVSHKEAVQWIKSGFRHEKFVLFCPGLLWTEKKYVWKPCVIHFRRWTEKKVKCFFSISCLKTIYKKIKEYIGFMVRVTFTRTYLMSEQGSYWLA